LVVPESGGALAGELLAARELFPAGVAQHLNVVANLAVGSIALGDRRRHLPYRGVHVRGIDDAVREAEPSGLSRVEGRVFAEQHQLGRLRKPDGGGEIHRLVVRAQAEPDLGPPEPRPLAEHADVSVGDEDGTGSGGGPRRSDDDRDGSRRQPPPDGVESVEQRVDSVLVFARHHVQVEPGTEHVPCGRHDERGDRLVVLDGEQVSHDILAKPGGEDVFPVGVVESKLRDAVLDSERGETVRTVGGGHTRGFDGGPIRVSSAGERSNRTFLVSVPPPSGMNDPVLLTGAGGRVGGAILDGLGDEYDWTLLYHSQPAEEPDADYFVGDVTDADLMAEACDGVESVVHLAGDPRRDAPWESVLQNNIHGTKVLYDAAIDAGVEKLVYASSNHAVGHFETERKPDLYRTDDDFKLNGTELPRPGNFYGVSKVAGETLGRYYHDEHGVAVCNIRIGNLTKAHPPIDYERGQAMWLSHRDCAHLHQRALEAEYEYEIVYGISDNDRKYYSLERAKEALGYEPKDNSAHFSGEERVEEPES